MPLATMLKNSCRTSVLPPMNGHVAITATCPPTRDSCTTANGDRWMVAGGWAVAYRRYSLYYVADEDAAQQNIGRATSICLEIGHNAENGFCVLRAKARGHRDFVTVVGHSATIAAGEWITASGEWLNDLR